MVRANEAVAELLERRRRARPLSRARAARPRGGRVAGRSAWRRSTWPPRRCPSCPTAPRAPPTWRGWPTPSTAMPAAGPPPAKGSRRSCCGRCSSPAMTRETSATRGSPAARTATSPRRSGATPTWSATGRCCTGWAPARGTTTAGELGRARRAHLGSRAGGGGGRASRHRDLPRPPAPRPAVRARLGVAVRRAS